MKRLAIISSIIASALFDVAIYKVCGFLWMIPILSGGMYSNNEVINFFLDIYSWVLLYNYPAIGIAYIAVKSIQQSVNKMCTYDEQIECVINILMSIMTCHPLAMIRLKDIDTYTTDKHDDKSDDTLNDKPTDDAIEEENDRKIMMLINEYKKMCSKVIEEMDKKNQKQDDTKITKVDSHDIGDNFLTTAPAHSSTPNSESDMNSVADKYISVSGDKLTDAVKDKHVDKQNPAAAHDVKATYDFISAVGPSAIAPSP